MKVFKLFLFLALMIVPGYAHAWPAVEYARCRDRVIYEQELLRSCVVLTNYFHRRIGSKQSPVPPVHGISSDPQSASPEEWYQLYLACSATYPQVIDARGNCLLMLDALME